MGSTRAREREYERRRYEKRLVRMGKAQRRHRRNQILTWVLVVLIAGGGTVVGLVLNHRGRATEAAASASSSARASAATSATPHATATVPAASVAEGRTWTGTLTLSQGALGIQLDGAAAPQAVANFLTLARSGFYDGLTCHRLDTSIKIVQCGDPNGDGTGGPGYTFGPIENAPSDGVYPAGTIAMARSSAPDSQGSQFFICYQDTTIASDSGGYTVFGKVTSGLDVVQRIAAAGTQSASSQKPASTVTIKSVETQ